MTSTEQTPIFFNIYWSCLTYSGITVFYIKIFPCYFPIPVIPNPPQIQRKIELTQLRWNASRVKGEGGGRLLHPSYRAHRTKPYKEDLHRTKLGRAKEVRCWDRQSLQPEPSQTFPSNTQLGSGILSCSFVIWITKIGSAERGCQE